MSRNTLTDKERVFALAVADGHTQYEAYQIAYDTKTDRRATIDNNAYMVANKQEVKEYIEELRKKREDRELNAKMYSDINDINKRYALIWDRIEECKKKNDDAAISRYMDIINKMTGTYVNINKDISEKDTTLSNLSTEDLKALLDKEV